MEEYKDFKIQQNINVKLTTARPNSQASKVSIGTVGPLSLNTMKYNPGLMSGIQLLTIVFSANFLGNLISYLIEDFQSDGDLSEYVVWMYSEIIYYIVRLFIPSLIIYQNQGFRQYKKFALHEFCSEFNISFSLHSSNITRLSPSQCTLNAINVELQEPNDKLGLKIIEEEIKTEPGMPQELQSVFEGKGKGKGKGQSNFKKGNISEPKYIPDGKPEEIKREP